MAVIFILFRTQGRSLVYQADGWRQHLRALTYYGKYLRGALRHLIYDHSLSPQTWGTDFGYGSDVLTTLQYYCLGDPLAALSVFVPTSYSMALYEALVVIRPFLAGLAFLGYAKVRGADRTSAALTGALVYAFSGTVLYIGFLHPYFVNPMIYFPLMLIGIEIAIERGNCIPFAVFTALSALCNFYFFYMIVIFTVAYAVARLLQLHGASMSPDLDEGIATKKRRGKARKAARGNAAGSKENAGVYLAPDDNINDILPSVGTRPVESRLPYNWENFSYTPEEDEDDLDDLPDARERGAGGDYGARGAGAGSSRGLDAGNRSAAGTSSVASRASGGSTGSRGSGTASGSGVGSRAAGGSTGSRNSSTSAGTSAAGSSSSAPKSRTFTVLQRTFRDGGRLFLYALLGALAAGVILVPVLVQFVNDPRASVKHTLTALYDADYYLQLPLNLVSWINHPRYDTELCFALTFVPLLVYFLVKKGHRTLKICLGLCALLLIFPLGGAFLNGFAYMINRWTWALAMLAGWISVRAADGIGAELERGGKGGRLGPSGIPPAAVAAIPALTALAILWNIVYAFSPSFRAFPNEFMEVMTPEEFSAAAMDNESTSVSDAVSGDVNSSLVRYSGRNLQWNAALGSGVSSTQFEFSFANGAMSDYFQLIGVNDEQNFAYLALDDRMPALSLAGVRYYTLAYDNYYEYRFLPYGAYDLGMMGNYHIYDNPYALPLAYPQRNIITRDELEKLSLPVREETLMRAAAPQRDIKGDGGEVRTGLALNQVTAEDADSMSSSYEIPFDVICDEDVSFNDGSFDVTGNGGEARLSFESVSWDELYLCFEGLEVSGPAEMYSMEFTALTDGEEHVMKTLNYKTPDLPYYSDWHDFALNFGSAGENVTEINISFPSAGHYAFDRMYLTVRPMNGIPDELLRVAAEGMRNVDMHENEISRATCEITGELSLSQEALLVFNLPYSKGFTAYIDGKKSPIYKTNAMFMSTPVNAGFHSIRLVYRTPGMVVGLILSIIGVAALLFLWRRQRGEE